MPSRISRSGPSIRRQIELGEKKLPAEVSKRLAKDVAPALVKNVGGMPYTHMPKRHGYGVTLGRALRFLFDVKTGSGMTMTVWADGKGRRRALPQLNRGILRHPTFGRRGPGDWVDQTAGVRPDFIGAGVRKTRPTIRRALRDALRDAFGGIGH